jgi:leucyl aminopeptidase (aminopeptidase T)
MPAASSPLAGAAATAVDCLGVAPGERVAVVYTPDCRSIGLAIAAAAEDRLAVVEQREFEQPGSRSEPPAEVVAALDGADVVFAATHFSLSHTAARIAATERGARIASLPGVSDEIFARAVATDYVRMSLDGDEIARLLTAADRCHITCPHGTDLTLHLEGRDGRNDDGNLRGPAAFGNLPAGEGYIAPLEHVGGGTLVIDGSIAGYGLLEDPLRLTIVDGLIVEAEGSAAAWLLDTLGPAGGNGRRLAELGIGTNPAARVTGSIIDDEKVRGTAHVAFGTSTGVGGVNQAGVHIDGVLLTPTIRIGGFVVAQDGELLV